VVVAIIGRSLVLENRFWLICYGRLALKKAFYRIKHFAGCPCFVNRSSELASVPNTVRKPASELLHFSHSVGLIGQLDFLVVARE
jgi:hypothetical protein